MNTKNRLIEKLLKVAKKHKILTYPVLALVAVISVFHYFFSWSTGAGKRIVAIVMVLVMLVSQSYFLTSSATALVDTEETVQEQQELQEQKNGDLVDASDAEEPVEDSKESTGLVESETPTEVVEEEESTTTEESTGDETTESDTEQTEDGTDNTEESQNSTEDTTGTSEDVFTEDETSEALTEGNTTTEAPAGDVPVYTEDEPNAEKVDNTSTTSQVQVIFQAEKVDGSGTATVGDSIMYATDNGDGTYSINSANFETADAGLASMSAGSNGCIVYEGWYTDSKFSGTPVDHTSTFEPILESGIPVIRLYAKKKLMKYEVTVSDTGEEFKVTETETVTQVQGKNRVYVVSVVDGVASVILEDVKKLGYTLTGASITSGSWNNINPKDKPDRTSSQAITITLTGTQYKQTINLGWMNDKYTIQYATSDAEDATIVSDEVTYGGDDLLFGATDLPSVATAKPGWEFKYWIVEGLDAECPPNTEIKNVPGLQELLYTNENLVLTPFYEYKGIIFGVDGVYAESDAIEVEFQYMLADLNGKKITGKHVVNSGKEKFEYELISDVTALKNTYGIDVTLDKNGGITFSTGGPLQTTIQSGVIPVEFRVTDTEIAADGPNASQRTVEGKVNVKINQCAVKISSSIIPSKTYDGTVNVDNDIIPNSTKLSVVDGSGNPVEGAYVTFNACTYDDENVGSKKTVSLSGCSLIEPTGKEGNYTLVSDNGVCTINGVITKRNVFVKTSVSYQYGRNYVRAGEEENPQLLVIEDKELNTGDNGFVGGDANDLSSLAIPYLEPTRNDSLLSGAGDKETYRVYVNAAKESNYNFILNSTDTNATAKFDVILEGVTDDMYMISSDASTDGWYGGSDAIQLQPVSTKGYDRIRLSEKDDWSTAITLTEENTVNNQITFQLGDSTTGAYTAWKTITVKIDQKAPEFVSYEITEKGTSAPGNGLYFPSLNGTVSFGNYFNKSVIFSIRYKDERSTPETLYYTLSNTLGGEITGQQTVKFGEADASGYATAVIEVDAVVGQDKLGSIQFYADDEAGNTESQVNTLKRDMNASNSPDEWAVEKTGPEISNWGVSSTLEDDSVISVKNGADRYYTKCTAHFTAKDSTSGLYGVTWYIETSEGTITHEERVKNTNSKVTEQDFTLDVNAKAFPSENGVYTVYAVVKDNAGNESLQTNPVLFKVDDVKPDVGVVRNYDTYQKEVKLEFYSLDNLSGIQYIKVENDNGEVKYKVEEITDNEDGYTHYCYMDTTQKGNYYIEVADKAGNVYKETIVLDKVSSEVPPCPDVTFLPEANESGWITAEDAKAIIANVLETAEDKTPVDTKYQLWKDGETSMHVTTLSSTASSEEISIPDGIHHLRVWSESRTGIVCKNAGEDADENGHFYTIQVDSIEPIIEYELQKGSDNSLVVNFTVKDEISGVNGDTIKAYNGNNEVVIKTTALEDGSGYTGSFNITEVGNYSIVASDIAGNEAKAPAFKPMSMKVNAVKNISNSSATVGAQIFKGSYAISSANIAYRKITDMQYTETDSLPVLDETTGNMVVSAALSDLAQGTNYAYKVTATSEAGEVLTYEGYFKTLSDKDAGVTISGTARYLSGEAGYITVGLFDGNACIRATEVNTSESNAFSFSNVPDGNYSIVATDSEFTTTKRILIADNTIIYPDSGTIDLVLSGNNTSVEITTNETPKVTAGNMDSLFNDETNYTEEDKQMVEQGNGTVEFKLYATLMKVSAVGASEISAMYAAASSSDKIVGAYLDLSLYKVITDADGNVSRKQVHNLGGGANISITIPLGDLADKTGLEVVRIHKNGDNFTGAYLVDQDNNPSTYTIVSSQYSTYAILHDPEVEEEPTTEAPTTEAPTTEAIVDGTINPSNSGSIYNTTEDTSVDPDDEDDEKVNDTEKEDDDKKSGSSVGSLTSSGSAKTGDATPVMLLFGMMLLSIGGVVVLRKKVK